MSKGRIVHDNTKDVKRRSLIYFTSYIYAFRDGFEALVCVEDVQLSDLCARSVVTGEFPQETVPHHLSHSATRMLYPMVNLTRQSQNDVILDVNSFIYNQGSVQKVSIASY